MLFNFPTFINAKEQSQSDRLYNNVKILVQTNVNEIWYDIQFGTDIRNHIKDGISNIAITDIYDELVEKLTEYFSNELKIDKLDIYQVEDKLRVFLDYIELRTGLHKTILTEQDIINRDTSFYSEKEGN